MDKYMSKNSIRKQILSERASLTPDFIHSYEVSAVERLATLNAFKSAKVIMMYMDFRGEAPTKLLIESCLKAGKKLVLPFTDANFHILPFEVPIQNNLSASDSGLVSPFASVSTLQSFLKQSSLGIFEPDPALCTNINPLDIDLILVPGVAFDKEGNRLGYGKGCYDEFLPKLRQDALKLGLAYDLQILESIPQEPTDIKVDGIL